SAVAARGRRRLQPERSGPRLWLGERIGAEQVGGEAGEVAASQIVARPLEEQVVDERVLDVHEDGDGGVNRRQLLHGEYGHEETAPRAAVLPRDLDPHEPQLEEIGRASCRERVKITGVAVALGRKRERQE